jgi:membrane protease YdiL (CAAX protease family)
VQETAPAGASDASVVPARPYRVRARVLLAYLLLSQFLGLALVLVATRQLVAPEHRDSVDAALLGVVPYAILVTLLLRPLARTGSSLRRLLGPLPDAAARRWAFEAGVALVALSFAFAYAIHLPLSVLAPGFVESWILDTEWLLPTSGELLPLAWIMSFVTMVVAAPFAEEILFRGLLLPAWADRWGERKAVVRSSLLFALLHPEEPFGAFLFAAVLAVVFLRTRSLWLPILCHAANNLLAWLLVAGGQLAFGSDPWTIAEFRASWWQGLVALLLGAPLLVRTLRRMPPALAPGRMEERAA